MHARSAKLASDPRMPSWASVVLAVLVVLVTCAPGWAQPRASACGVDGDDEAVDDEEVIELDPEVPPDTDVRGIVLPPVRRVLAAAYRSAGLDGHPTTSWTRRARLAGLVPWISVRSGRNTSWADDQTRTVDHGMTLEARATWRLDRLVFDPHELQVASIDAARRRERRRLANRVIRAYFTFLRTASAARVRGGWSSHAEEAAAELDALTDAWFSEELGRLRRTASESRTF